MDRDRVVRILCVGMMCCAATLFLATESRNSSALATADAKQQVLDLERRWVDAEIQHDEASLRRILDDKFVVSFGAGQPHDKETFIKAILSGAVDPTETQDLTDRTVIVDEDTAIVIGTDTMHQTKNGAARTRVARYTATYIHRHGQWMALAEHMLEVPQTK